MHTILNEKKNKIKKPHTHNPNNKTDYSYTTDNRLFQEFLYLLGKITHTSLIRQIEYIKAENQILRDKLGKRISTTASEKRRLIKFALPLGGDIKNIISIVNYSTFRRWITGNTYQRKQAVKGRPKKSTQQIQELIILLAKENPSWGYTRIMGELKKLDIVSLSRNTIKSILKNNGIDPAPKRNEDSWDAFIKRHFETLWACDFFTKTVWTSIGPKIFYVLFFINIRTRKVHIAGMTQKPTQDWVNKTTKKVSVLFTGDESKLLIRDGDKKFSKKFDDLFLENKILVKKIPYRSPNLNPYAEGFVGTIKRECLDKFFVFGKTHFEYLVKEYVQYYNTKRPHSGIDNFPPDHDSNKSNGIIECASFLGGTLKHYYVSKVNSSDQTAGCNTG